VTPLEQDRWVGYFRKPPAIRKSYVKNGALRKVSGKKLMVSRKTRESCFFLSAAEKSAEELVHGGSGGRGP